MEMAIWSLRNLERYDQLNQFAEFVLNGEANESVVVRIDYHDHGAEMHYYEVEQQVATKR